MNLPYRKTETSYQNALLGLIAGAGIGLVIGLLTAPKSGSKLRAELGEALDDYFTAASDKVNGMRATASKYADKAKEKASDAVNDTVKSAASAVEESTGEAQDAAHDAINKTVSAVHTGAKKSHAAVDQAANAVRGGTRGYAA